MFASTCIDVVEAHALIADESLDLVDVSTLAELYLAAKRERGPVAA